MNVVRKKAKFFYIQLISNKGVSDMLSGKLKIVVLIILASTSSFGYQNNVYADDLKLDPFLVYEIGGVTRIPPRRNEVIPIGAGLNWHNNLMCGEFDMSLSVTNLLNGLSGQMKKLYTDLLASITGVISSWPMMEIARADPQLYEMLQQGRLEASAIFDVSIANCKQMSNDVINNGYDSVSNWVQVSGYEDWMKSASKESASSNDVVQVVDDVDSGKGNAGVTWVDGEKRAGDNQKPIELIKDITGAGYKSLGGEKQPAPGFTEFWATKEDMAKWLVEVLGETTIRTCQNCDRLKTSPGKGAYTHIETVQKDLAKQILKIVKSPSPLPSEADLKSVSAPGYQISAQIIEALRKESLYQSTLIERLAEDLATAKVTEMLIASRRVLIAGQREANVSKNKEAVSLIEHRIKEVSDEMNMLRQDAELRQMMRQSLPTVLLERGSSKKTQATGRDDTTVDAVRDLLGGK